MCLNKICGTVRVGKHLTDIFSIRNGWRQRDALSPLLFRFTLEDSGKPEWIEIKWYT